jgi:hypothetical protein
MADSTPRKADLQRWRGTVIRHLDDFPRQYGALEHAMGAFGEDFDLKLFKQAYDTEDDLDAYNQVQALERAFGRVQNYVADLAEAGARLAQMSVKPAGKNASRAQRSFEALRDGAVIDKSLCRRLILAQNARSRVEHSYVEVPAGDVHRAAALVHETARLFIGPYAAWIAQHLAK